MGSKREFSFLKVYPQFSTFQVVFYVSLIVEMWNTTKNVENFSSFETSFQIDSSSQELRQVLVAPSDEQPSKLRIFKVILSNFQKCDIQPIWTTAIHKSPYDQPTIVESQKMVKSSNAIYDIYFRSKWVV